MSHLRRRDKIQGLKLAKTPRGGVFIFASRAEKNRKKTPPPWRFCRESPVLPCSLAPSVTPSLSPPPLPLRALRLARQKVPATYGEFNLKRKNPILKIKVVFFST